MNSFVKKGGRCQSDKNMEICCQMFASLNLPIHLKHEEKLESVEVSEAGYLAEKVGLFNFWFYLYTTSRFFLGYT